MDEQALVFPTESDLPGLQCAMKPLIAEQNLMRKQSLLLAPTVSLRLVVPAPLSSGI